MRLNLSDEPVTAELLSETLRRTGSARIAINGTSMHPTLQMGWWIFLKPVEGRDLKPGQIALFRTEHNLTAHRLVWIERRAEGDTLVFRGDHNRVRERVPPAAVIAQVVAVEVPGVRRGLNRVVTLDQDALSIFYRGTYAIYALLRLILPAPAAPGAPIGATGRLLRRCLAAAERVLSFLLPQHR